MQSVRCKVICICDEVRVYFGDEFVVLTVYQAVQLADLLTDVVEHYEQFCEKNKKETKGNNLLNSSGAPNAI